MVGILLSYWGPAYFQGQTVSFREGKTTGPGIIRKVHAISIKPDSPHSLSLAPLNKQERSSMEMEIYPP